MQRIPTRIFQLWNFKHPDKPAIPATYDRLRESWFALNPGVPVDVISPAHIDELLQRDRVNGLRMRPQWRDIYASLPLWVQRCDMGRLLWLYFHGGVYCDMDTSCELPLAQWPDALPAARTADLILGKDTEEAWIATDHHGNAVSATNWVMAAAPGHPFLAHCLDAIRPEPPTPAADQDDMVLKTTGPHFISQELARTLHRHPQWFRHSVVNTDYLYGGFPGNPRQVPTVMLARHHFAGEWRDGGSWWGKGKRKHKRGDRDGCTDGGGDIHPAVTGTLVGVSALALVLLFALVYQHRRSRSCGSRGSRGSRD